MPLVAVALVVAVLGARAPGRARPRRRPSRWARIRSAVGRDIRDGLLARRAWLGVVLASALVVAGHVATFLIAARTAGSTAPPSRCCRWRCSCCWPWCCPNIGRLGSARGRRRRGRSARPAWARRRASPPPSSTACMVLVASLPGAAVLVVAWLRRPGSRAAADARCLAASRSPRRKEPQMADRPVHPAELRHVDRRLPRQRDRARLLLSNDADFDRVDAVRAACDAILVGAATVRNDNPRLLVRSQARRDERAARGLAPSPIKVTVTERVDARRVRRTSSPPATPRSSSTARARGSPRPARGSGRSRRWSTAASRWRCAGSARTSATAACGG